MKTATKIFGGQGRGLQPLPQKGLCRTDFTFGILNKHIQHVNFYQSLFGHVVILLIPRKTPDLIFLDFEMDKLSLPLVSNHSSPPSLYNLSDAQSDLKAEPDSESESESLLKIIQCRVEFHYSKYIANSQLFLSKNKKLKSSPPPLNQIYIYIKSPINTWGLFV